MPGHPEYGWRLTSAAYKQYLLAEYTVFWHHPNKACYGDATWVKDPPKDTATSTGRTTTTGTDPKIGSLGSGTGSGTTLTPGTTVTTRTEADGSVTTTTVTIVDNGNGTYTITTTSTNSYATANHRILHGRRRELADGDQQQRARRPSRRWAA